MQIFTAAVTDISYWHQLLTSVTDISYWHQFLQAVWKTEDELMFCVAHIKQVNLLKPSGNFAYDQV
jgi:hypothetical protein